MKNVRKVLSSVAASLAFITALSTEAATYTPQALTYVEELASSAEQNGDQPVVIFDLDDTLMNTRERNLRIINDFIAQSDIQARYPEETQKLADLTSNDIAYLTADTLKARSVTNAAFLKELTDFWLARFFTNEYCAKDQPNPGAVKYVRRLYFSGVKIVYLTGRDIPRMHDGTVASLKAAGFPLDDDQAVLIMKPDPKGDDLEFKKSMFPEIAKMGTVVGVFENEPANINAHHEAFPNAIAIFLDTIHSPKPDVPAQDIFWVKDFKKPRTVRLLSHNVSSESYAHALLD